MNSERTRCLREEIGRLEALDITKYHYPKRIACLKGRLQVLESSLEPEDLKRIVVRGEIL